MGQKRSSRPTKKVESQVLRLRVTQLPSLTGWLSLGRSRSRGRRGTPRNVRSATRDLKPCLIVTQKTMRIILTTKTLLETISRTSLSASKTTSTQSRRFWTLGLKKTRNEQDKEK